MDVQKFGQMYLIDLLEQEKSLLARIDEIKKKRRIIQAHLKGFHVEQPLTICFLCN